MRGPRCFRRRRRVGKSSPRQDSVKPSPKTTRPADDDYFVWLARKGESDGGLQLPPATEIGLGPVEAEVENRYYSDYKRKLEVYRKQEDVLLGHMKSQGSEKNADTSCDKDCQAMRAMVDKKRTRLQYYRNRVDEAHKVRKKVIEKYELDGTEVMKVPDSWPKFLGILAAVLFVETVINGIFFGANLAGALVGGMTYAVIISVVNVIFFGSMTGLLAAWLLLREYPRETPRRRRTTVVAVVCLALLLFMGVLLNLAVAHYREALPGDYPPAPAVALNDDVAGCRMGDDERVAGREAICLFLNEWFRLSEFESYILMLIGLAAFGFAAWKWSGRVERWPGYGKAEDDYRTRVHQLIHSEEGLVEELGRCRTDAVKKQESLLTDPIERYTIASEARDDIYKLHERFCEDSEDLQKECRRAIKIYRDKNRDARRGEPTPESWQAELPLNWKLPDVPTRPDIGDYADAERRANEAELAKEERTKKLEDCYRQCENEVRRLTQTEDVVQ